MSVTELRRRAKKTIDQLSGQRLAAAASFLNYVSEHGRTDATAELLAIPGFVESFARGSADLNAGRVKAWRKVRRDV